MGDHRAAAKVREAIGELDLAIRDFRNVLFDHQGNERSIAATRSHQSWLVNGFHQPMIGPLPKLTVWDQLVSARGIYAG